jgi:murein DD-endopeptidase MepM/ murein hydrolase activator NlpD
MGRGTYTFLIVAPHGKLRRIEIPRYTFYMLCAATVVCLMTLTALANSYARMLLKVSNYNNLRTEREALKNENRSLESEVKHTATKLDSLEALASDVALTYGFGHRGRMQLPQVFFALATQNNSTLESSFNASLYAFNLMERTALNPPRARMVNALNFTPDFDRSTIPSLWPVEGRVTASFGERMDPFSGEGNFHPGMDIAAPKGTEVRATADGIILRAGRVESGYGNEILIDHGSGITTKYGHLSQVFVVVGEEVKRGQVIGAVGMTGRSTGPHLHYEVLVHETPVNPAKFLRG